MKGIIFTGLQATGKSSFFLEKFYSNYLRLNMDMLKTRHREQILFQACLKAKQPCVIDNTNPTQADRVGYITAFKEARFEVAGYYFQSVLEGCLQRNAQRTGKARIPDIAIKGTYNKLELPVHEEGFDQLYYVRLTPNGFEVEDWQNEVH